MPSEPPYLKFRLRVSIKANPTHEAGKVFCTTDTPLNTFDIVNACHPNGMAINTWNHLDAVATAITIPPTDAADPGS